MFHFLLPILFITVIAPHPSSGQSQCGLNGRYEACKVHLAIKGKSETRKVVFLTDGKSVIYYAYNCSTPDEYAGGYTCKAKILEYNGRVTYGIHKYAGGGRIFITSDRGNTTALPYR